MLYMQSSDCKRHFFHSLLYSCSVAALVISCFIVESCSYSLKTDFCASAAASFYTPQTIQSYRYYIEGKNNSNMVLPQSQNIKEERIDDKV